MRRHESRSATRAGCSGLRSSQLGPAHVPEGGGVWPVGLQAADAALLVAAAAASQPRAIIKHLHGAMSDHLSSLPPDSRLLVPDSLPSTVYGATLHGRGQAATGAETNMLEIGREALRETKWNT